MRRTRTRCLVLAAGALVSITAAPALAQYDRQNDRDTRDRPAQRQVRATDARTARGLDKEIAHKLEGVWKVEIEMSPDVAHNKTGDDTPGRTPIDSDDMNRRNDRDRTDRDVTDRERGQSGASKVSMTGYARSDVIFGGNILRQSFVAAKGGDQAWHDTSTNRGTDGRPNTDRERDTDRDRDTDRNRDRDMTDRNRPADPGADDWSGDGRMRGMSFLSFDPRTNTYSAVFMDSQRPRIHYDTGRFDASSSRIEFDGSDVGMDQHAQSSGARDMDNVRVVLEIPSADRHVVTMYRDAKGMRGRTNTGAEIATGEVIYKATFTRVDGADAARARRMLDIDESGGASYTQHPTDD